MSEEKPLVYRIRMKIGAWIIWWGAQVIPYGLCVRLELDEKADKP